MHKRNHYSKTYVPSGPKLHTILHERANLLLMTIYIYIYIYIYAQVYRWGQKATPDNPIDISNL